LLTIVLFLRLDWWNIPDRPTDPAGVGPRHPFERGAKTNIALKSPEIASMALSGPPCFGAMRRLIH
jgi:hypothetical protein